MVFTEAHRSKLIHQLSQAHPHWAPQAWQDKALWFETELSAELQPFLANWLQTGAEKEYASGAFSLRKIMGLCGVDYLDALDLMDLYLKDPRRGQAAILPF